MQKKSVLTLAQNKPKILQPNFSPRNSASVSRGSNPSLSKLAAIKPLQKPQNKALEKSSSQQHMKENAKQLSENRPKVSFPPLSSLKNAKKAEDVKKLLIQNCKIASQKVDSNKQELSMFTTAKTDYLNDILSSLSDSSFKLPQDSESYSALFSLIASHIFQTAKDFPKLWNSLNDYYYYEVDKNLEDKEWYFKALIYDIAIAFFKRGDFDIEIANFLTCDLFKLVVYLMRTIYQKEQEKLEVLFVEIYKKMGKYRRFGLEVARSALTRISVNNDSFVGARSLLAVMRSITDGLKVPLKKSHKEFFHSTILPLHKHDHCLYFWTELVNLVLSYLEKDENLTVDAYKYIMGIWPRVCVSKQINFIEEIGMLASFVPNNSTTEVVHAIATQFNNTVMGVNTILAKKMLTLFDINDFVWLITEKPEDSYPVLIPSLFAAANTHWDVDSRDLSVAVLNVMRDNHPKIFNVVGKAMKSIENNKIMKIMERGLKWQILIENFEEDEDERKRKSEMVSILFVGCEHIAKGSKKGNKKAKKGKRKHKVEEGKQN